jgi:hypothetical protein
MRKIFNRNQALIAAACLVFIKLSSIAYAASQQSDEVVVGPIDYQQNVNGIPVTLSATTFARIETKDNQIFLKARVVGNLADLQRKIGSIIDTFDLPRDNCKSFSPKNPVVAIPRKELGIRDGAAFLSIGANVTVWACVENPIPNSKVEWEMCNLGFAKTKCRPHLITWPGSPIKTHVGAQNIDADLPVTLEKISDYAVGLRLSNPDINLGDCSWFACVAKGILQIGGVDINQKAYDALQKAIDPEKLKLTIPEELAKFNPTVESASFVNSDGNLAAEIRLSALVPASTITELIKELIEKGQKK